MGVSQQEDRVFISFKQSRLPEEHKHLHLVIHCHTCQVSIVICTVTSNII